MLKVTGSSLMSICKLFEFAGRAVVVEAFSSRGRPFGEHYEVSQFGINSRHRHILQTSISERLLNLYRKNPIDKEVRLANIVKALPRAQYPQTALEIHPGSMPFALLSDVFSTIRRVSFNNAGVR